MPGPTPDPFPPVDLGGSPALAEVVEYARRVHAGQQRDDGDPFIQHPLEAAALLHDMGHRPAVVAAAVLHDAVEDGPVELAELAERFGPEVAQLVGALTEDDRIASFADRKRALRDQVAAAGPEAAAIYAADKVSKARELRRLGSRGPLWDRRRMEHYRHSLAMLEQSAPADPLVRQLRDELRAL